MYPETEIPDAGFLPLPVAQPPVILQSPKPLASGPYDPSPEDSDLLDPEWAREPATEFLHDGTPLKLTYSRREMFLDAFPGDLDLPRSFPAAGFLIFLAANPRTIWNAPVRDANDTLAPLSCRHDALKDYLDGWKDRKLSKRSPVDVLAQASRLWMGSHASQVIIPEAAPDSKKKEEAGSPPDSSSALSPPVETPPAPSGSITSAPCSTPSGSSTATS